MAQVSSDAHVHINTAGLTTEAANLPTFNPLTPDSLEFLVSTQPRDWPHVRKIAATHSGIRAAIGLHPWFVKHYLNDNTWLDEMKQMLQSDSTLHVGEIGLDRSKRMSTEWEAQKKSFRAQLMLCCELQRCCAIHCVRGHGELFLALTEVDQSCSTLPLAINLHSWSGSNETAAAVLRLPRIGAKIFFGFSASVNLRNLMQFTFAKPMVVETQSKPRKKHRWYTSRHIEDTTGEGHGGVEDRKERIWVNLDTQEQRKQPWRMNDKAWNAFQSRLKQLPIGRLLVESDLSGFEARQDSIALMVSVVADAMNVTYDQLLHQCNNNLATFLRHTDGK